MTSERTKRIRERQADTSDGETFIVECTPTTTCPACHGATRCQLPVGHDGDHQGPQNASYPTMRLWRWANDNQYAYMRIGLDQPEHAHIRESLEAVTQDTGVVPVPTCAVCGCPAGKCTHFFCGTCNPSVKFDSDPFHQWRTDKQRQEPDLTGVVGQHTLLPTVCKHGVLESVCHECSAKFAVPSIHMDAVLVAARRVILDWHAWNKDNSGEAVNWESLRELETVIKKAGAR